MTDWKRARKRILTSFLNEKFDAVKNNADQVHFDNVNKTAYNASRDLQIVIGKYVFLLNSKADYMVNPDYSFFRFRFQEWNGVVQDEWQEQDTVGQLDDMLRMAKASREKTAADIKAIKGNDKHEGKTPDNLILVGLTGSHAYGLNHNGFVDVDGNVIPASDLDTRGVFVVPTREILSLGKHRELVEQKETDTKYDEVERFMTLCLQCNPERLEMLASEKTLMTPFGQLLVENQKMFLSKRVIKTYGGYARQQMYRIESRGERTTKPAMHLIRLMLTGIGILEYGQVQPRMDKYKDELMAIRKGKMSIEEVFKWHRELETIFAKLADKTKLPNEPDIKLANKILLDIRKEYLTW